MSKLIIKCSTFMKNEDFLKLKETIINDYQERDIVVLPVYCSLEGVIDDNNAIDVLNVQEEAQRTEGDKWEA